MIICLAVFLFPVARWALASKIAPLTLDGACLPKAVMIFLGERFSRASAASELFTIAHCPGQVDRSLEIANISEDGMPFLLEIAIDQAKILRSSEPAASPRRIARALLMSLAEIASKPCFKVPAIDDKLLMAEGAATGEFGLIIDATDASLRIDEITGRGVGIDTRSISNCSMPMAWAFIGAVENISNIKDIMQALGDLAIEDIILILFIGQALRPDTH